MILDVKESLSVQTVTYKATHGSDLVSVAIAVVPWTLIVIYLCCQCRKEKTTLHLDEYFKVSFFTGHGITEADVWGTEMFEAVSSS